MAADEPSALPDAMGGVLAGIRVVEVSDEKGAHAALLLAGLGAEVIKVEPPEGCPTRNIGPFVGPSRGAERSAFFLQHNRGKKSVSLDLDDAGDADRFRRLVATADVLLESTDKGYLAERKCGLEQLRAADPALVTARVTAFGDDGPWSHFRGSDLVHLALGGPMMNCGYDPQPGGTYDLPPIAPQAWHSYIIAGEQIVIGILAALVSRAATGSGQHVTLAIHEAVSKSTELDLMSWVMRHIPLNRQTCRHAAEMVSDVPTIAQTKDGRWFVTMPLGGRDEAKIIDFLDGYGMAGDMAGSANEQGTTRSIPGSGGQSERSAHLAELVQRFTRKFTYENVPWHEAQAAGVVCAPLRKPHENVTDAHWAARSTFAEVEHPELGQSLTYAARKWLSTAPAWTVGRRAPLLNEDGTAVWASVADEAAPADRRRVPASARRDSGALRSALGKPFALQGVRVLDFTWFLASAGGTRFLASLGAECIKVEWKANPDTRIAAMAPVGGRKARFAATGPLPGVADPDMGGQFNNKNPGKRGLSLNVRDPRGLDIARRLVARSDIVAEGFSPGVMDRWGLGYRALCDIKPDIIYAQQSGMGSVGRYGRYRAVGPVAAALSGISEMSGLPEPAMPAGWGYSYLDWIGAYSFASSMLAALLHRARTGEGQWIDASQTESGIYILGSSILEWSATGRIPVRTGNRAVGRPAAPHGAYRCAGDDRWVAIACTDDAAWDALAKLIGGASAGDERFATLEGRLACADDLDAVVSRWTSGQDPYDVMTRLQAAGVAAGVCQTAADRCERDPQLAHLRWLTEVTGTKIGTWPVAEVPFTLSETPPYAGGPIDRGAPCYGEDNEWVLGELLGMSSREMAELADDGVI